MFVPDIVKYWPPFSAITDGEKEEMVGFAMDRTSNEVEKSEPVKPHDTACNPGFKAENGKVHST
jgi:hypothetical protein